MNNGKCSSPNIEDDAIQIFWTVCPEVSITPHFYGNGERFSAVNEMYMDQRSRSINLSESDTIGPMLATDGENYKKKEKKIMFIMRIR